MTRLMGPPKQGFVPVVVIEGFMAALRAAFSEQGHLYFCGKPGLGGTSVLKVA